METKPKAFVLFAGQIVEPCATIEEAQAIAADMRAYWEDAPQSDRDDLGWHDCSVESVLTAIEVMIA